MRGMIPGPVLAMLFVGATAGAAHAQVCVEIDAPRDTLDPQDRAAAVLLLTRQFALAGEEVAAELCHALCAGPREAGKHDYGHIIGAKGHAGRRGSGTRRPARSL